jgi:3'(2'), 5'-bisphosphate nucleotidase
MFERELEIASVLARQAGKILMEVFHTDFEVEQKQKGEPVTIADKRANAYLVSELRKYFPTDGIVAEETPDQSDALRAGRCWYVDPLDGTKEFIAGRDDFAVMLGLAVQGEAKAGVVYQPACDKLYAGADGVGAYLEQHAQRSVLRVREVADPTQLTMVASRSHRSHTIDQVIDRLGIHKQFASGSVGIKVGLIAEQQADLYLLMSDKSSLWDACGPEAILKAAGGRFTTLDGQPHRYGGQDMRNRGGILACNETAFTSVLQAVHEVLRSSRSST